MTLLIFAFFFFFLMAMLVLLALVYDRRFNSKRKIDRRLNSYAADLGLNAEKMPFVLRDERLSDISALNRVLHRLNFAEKLRHLLEQADSSLTVGTVVLLTITLAALGLLATRNLQELLPRIILGVALAALPLLYILYRRGRRLRAFVRAFPDALDMMTSSLRAGHALNKALQMVAIEAPDPVCVEFRKTFEENNLGLPLRDALLHLTQRVKSLDLKLFVTAVLLQRETGGNLAEILEKISYTIRERFKLMGQIRTFTAQGRMTLWVLGSLPLVALLALEMINPDYIAPMLQERFGRTLLAVGFCLQLVGFMVIRRIIRIKFQ
ncbi:MAG TPA: type II secretion system F family protein [bacterium]|nr:type II secretion system F family protein [bacterium]HPR86848.1 type II secretion system F family protein [bacterium]